MALDAVNLGEQGVSFGFGVARTATQIGFGTATTVLRTLRLTPVEQVVEMAHTATRFGQDFAEGITQSSLGVARFGLEASGAQEGELLRLGLGDEAAESIIMVLKMVRGFCKPLSGVTLSQLFYAAQSWSEVQHAARLEKLQRGGPPPTTLALPPFALRWMRFSAATFGTVMMAGMADGFSLAPAMRARETAPDATQAERSLASANLQGRVTVLSFEENSSEHFVPGYMVAVDHEVGCVVVALRGTSTARDALVDLVCEAVPCELAGMEGLAHGGMLRAAKRLMEPLLAHVKEGLSLLAAERAQGLSISKLGTDVLVTGHSLGGGVAALLAALWRDAAALPVGCSMRCVTFGCPQVLDASHALALSNFTTSVVLGDDLVPRLSLTTVQDLREALLRLNDPQAFGLPQELGAKALATLAQGGVASQGSLAAAHTAVVASGSRGEMNRLYPAGRLIILRKASLPASEESKYAPLEGSQVDVDELLLSSDMAAAHMPARYLKALGEASDWPDAAQVSLNGLG